MRYYNKGLFNINNTFGVKVSLSINNINNSVMVIDIYFILINI